MGWSVLEDGTTTVDLVALANTTGWSGSGSTATHDSCNTGSIYLIPPTGIVITAGHTYHITFQINSISGGFVQPYMGTTAGTAYTTAGFKTFDIVCAGASPRFRFLSDANCEIEIFNIQDTVTDTSQIQKNTICYAEKNNKWSDFRTYVPDLGFAMFTDLFTMKYGNLYQQEHGANDRNEFYGTQYQTIISIPFNGDPAQSNTFEAVSVQSNMILITTTDGVTTSLGQVSELIASDFLKDTLTDGSTTVTVTDVEGVYSAPLMRDKNIDIVNGPVLKGNWIKIELITTAATPLKLFSVAVHSEKSFIGSR